MKRLVLSAYRFREHLGEQDLRQLTRKFAELGAIPGVIAHYARLDGMGGFMIEEVSEDPERSFELTLRYAPWVEFEVFPITTIEDAFPVMQRVFGWWPSFRTELLATLRGEQLISGCHRRTRTFVPMPP